jgi:ABC-type amino acid transport substrate-binding protein
LSLLFCSFLSALADGDKDTIGVLSLLNLSEEDYFAYKMACINAIQYLAELGAVEVFHPGPDDSDPQFVFYDDLNTMLLGLNAGDIQKMEVPQSTAEYLCSVNDTLTMDLKFKNSSLEGFLLRLFDRVSESFSFLMLEENESLRDDFNAAITAMQEDGTMDALIREHITDVVSNGEIKPVLPEKKDGRETLTVAVTGSLPPMDYIAPDGSYAGFSTAVLAEIGKRLDKNIELVTVDCVGRAAALASGAADVAFWTRSSLGSPFPNLDDKGFEAFISENHSTYTEEEIVISEALSESLSREKRYNRDIPEGTINTKYYYKDIPVTVSQK